MKVRKAIRIIHRDLGYIFFALTVIYAFSGIAVNHADDWNPNYIIEKNTVSFAPNTDTTLTDAQMISYLKTNLQLQDSLISHFRESAKVIQLFFNNKNLKANLSEGKAVWEVIESRSVFRESNYLHLNNAKGLWTWIADLFALGLIILAFTGLFMIKGKKGITGRGAWLTAIGLIIPVLFLILYYY